MFASISINNKCNLRCKMCDIGQKNKKSSGLVENWSSDDVLTPEQWQKIFIKHNIKNIHVVGTEPLLYKELGDFLKLTSKISYIYLTTNGFLCAEKNIDLLAKYCNKIAISIDGASAKVHDKLRGVKGSFAKANTMLKGLIKKKKLVKISYAITPDNVNDMKSAYDLFTKKLGVGIVFNHYNYIHPLSCKTGTCKPSNIDIFNPIDVDTHALLEAIRYCKRSTFLPNLSTKHELDIYYKTIPTKRIIRKPGCGVLNDVLRGKRCAINSDGQFLPSARCWIDMKFGNALNSTIANNDKILKKVTHNMSIKGLPAQCQRLCCAGKVLE